MNKLLVVLIAGAFAAVAAAQTTPPKPTAKQRAADVSATTQAGSGSSASTQKTSAEQAASVRASKEVSKMTAAEKKAFAQEINKLQINPDNSSGVGATATMQKQTTMESKGQPKANAELKTKAGQKEVSKDLQQKASK